MDLNSILAGDPGFSLRYDKVVNNKQHWNAQRSVFPVTLLFALLGQLWLPGIFQLGQIPL